MKKILITSLLCGFCIPALFAFSDIPHPSELDSDLTRLSLIGVLPENLSLPFSGSTHANKASLISYAALASCTPCEMMGNPNGSGAGLFQDRSINDPLNGCSRALDNTLSVHAFLDAEQGSCSSLLNASGSWCGNSPLSLESALRTFIATVGLTTTSTGIIDKSIALGLITDAERNIPLTTTISRAKLAHFARITADINRCSTQASSQFSTPVAIHIYKGNNTNSCRWKGTELIENIHNNTPIDLFADTLESTGATFTWKLTQIGTSQTLNFSGQCLQKIILPSPGTWIIQTTVHNPQFTNAGIATVQQVVTSSTPNRCATATCACPAGLTCTSNDAARCSTSATCIPTNALSSRITANNVLFWEAPYTLTLRALVTWMDEHASMEWNKDGIFSQTWSRITLSFADPGSHTIELIIKENNTTVARSNMVVGATESLDIDRDGLTNDVDACPEVFWPKSNRGCPVILASCGGNCICPNGFTCSSLDTTTCATKGVCQPSPLPVNDVCLAAKIKETGVIGGHATCTRCPCEYNADFLQSIRSCDILVPAVLSPDKTNIFARGTPYRIW